MSSVNSIIVIAFLLLFASGWRVDAQTSFNDKIFTKHVVRIIDLKEKEATFFHHLTDLSSDTTLLEMISIAMKEGKVKADSSSDHTYADWLIPGNSIITDTITLFDVVSGKEVQKLIQYPFPYDFVHAYAIKEDWAFNPSTGITDIKITDIAPLLEKHNYIGSTDSFAIGWTTICWFRYNDVKEIIARYEQYHPTNTIAGHIWNDYFLSDVKPSEVK